MELVRQKNIATIITFPLVDANGAIVSGATGKDSQWDGWNDGTAPNGFTACTNEATEVGSSGVYYLSLTATEMNNDYIIIQVISVEALTQFILIRTMVGDPLNLATTESGALVWSSATRTITGGALTTPADYKADVTNLDVAVSTRSSHSPADVWSVGTKVITGGVLTTPADYKADVSGLATESNATSNRIAVIAEIDANEAKLDIIDVVVDSILEDTETTIPGLLTTIQADLDNPDQYKANVASLALEATVQAIKALTDNLPANTANELIYLKGLNGLNAVIEYGWTTDDNTSATIYLYDTSANAQTNDHVTGLMDSLTMGCTFTLNKPQIQKVYT